MYGLTQLYYIKYVKEHNSYIFTVVPCILMLSVFYLPTDAQ